MLTCDHYHMPTSLADALAMWRDAADGSRLVAGATDILPWAREGRAGNVHLPAMIDLSRVANSMATRLLAGACGWAQMSSTSSS